MDVRASVVPGVVAAVLVVAIVARSRGLRDFDYPIVSPTPKP
ncbi:MAG TPA: hypothetical protein VE623_21585 [Acidimicrobiales bacterium]|nr:hypothetical protein [Acidimicrobiales bacterium]